MGEMYDRLCSWRNLQLAHQKAARGKRGKAAVAAFEYNLADHLLELQYELVAQTYQPGPYDSFIIHEPKRWLISAANGATRPYPRYSTLRGGCGEPNWWGAECDSR